MEGCLVGGYKGKGLVPQCSLDLYAKGEEETLHSSEPSIFEYVSLLPSKAEGKKLVIEDSPKVLEEELIRGVSYLLRGVLVAVVWDRRFAC